MLNVPTPSSFTAFNGMGVVLFFKMFSIDSMASLIVSSLRMRVSLADLCEYAMIILGRTRSRSGVSRGSGKSSILSFSVGSNTLTMS